MAVSPLFFFGLLASLRHSFAGECLPVSDNIFHCFSHHQPATICDDVDPECENWALAQECQKNPDYMLTHCRKSCETCLDGHAGMTQIAPDLDLTEPILRHLTSTVQYLETATKTTADHSRKSHPNHHPTPNSCVNRHPHCTYWAVLGKCNATKLQQDQHTTTVGPAADYDAMDEQFMKTHCAAACHVCHISV
jgi:hypothetical protein